MELDRRPRRFTVYAPDGTSTVMVGWLDMGYVPPPKEQCHLLFTPIGDNPTPLNKLAVIVNAETGKVVYQPRAAPPKLPWADPSKEFLTVEEKDWLKKNPHWPNLLEIDLSDRDDEPWDIGG